MVIKIILLILIGLMSLGLLLFLTAVAVYIIKNDLKIKKLNKYRSQGKKCNICNYREYIYCNCPGKECKFESNVDI